MTIPPEFGASWQQFVNEWCLGAPPAHTTAEVSIALDAIVRLLPNYVGGLISGPDRGLGVIAPAINRGLVLAACESMTGFDAVLRRFQQGDRSAFSELAFAAGLERTGLHVELEPASPAGKLDAAFDWEGSRVFAEVISPERADAIVAAQQDIQHLANAIRDTVKGSTVEVLLEGDLTPEINARVLEAINDLPLDQLRQIPGLATMIRRAASAPLQLGPTLPSERPGPIIAAAAGQIGGANGRVDPTTGAAGIVRMPFTDSRARRLLAAELHHFSRDAHNILAVDITKVTVGPKEWSPLIARSFQPGQNRRIGAAVLFSRALVGDPLTTREAWTVVPNPHAYKPMQPDLVRQIQSLDQSAFSRGQAPDPPA